MNDMGQDVGGCLLFCLSIITAVMSYKCDDSPDHRSMPAGFLMGVFASVSLWASMEIFR